MVAVIVILQLGVAFLLAYPVGFGHFPDALIKVGVQVFFRDAAEIRVTEVHRDVVEVVESAEDAELAEFGDPGEESEAEFAVLALHHAVEALQAAAERLPERFVARRVQKRLVVFVNQNHDGLAGLFISSINDVRETGIGHRIAFADLKIRLPKAQMPVQAGIEVFHAIVFFPAQIQMQYRIFRPILFQFLDGQSFE